MTFFALSILAGILTILAPCILPALPVVIGASEGNSRALSRRAMTVIVSLAISVIAFTLLLKASTLFIDIPQSFWNWFSGTILVVLGFAMVLPALWEKVPLLGSIQIGANKILGDAHNKQSVWGDIIMGAALGPVFTTCSPTYFFILATVLPADVPTGFIYLLGFVFGLALSLSFVALLGQKFVHQLLRHHVAERRVKRVFGVMIILLGVFVAIGYDKKLSSTLLDLGIGGAVNFEERLIERVKEQNKTAPSIWNVQETGSRIERQNVAVPLFLKRAFPNTDFSQVHPSLERALPGGPGKDGIPALTEPKFIPLSASEERDAVQAIVLKDGNAVKVYPYNILVWHEIVNDTANGTPVAVTFCPLCGSALVFDRRLADGVTTFGVSGALLESNMVMYDRATESLWQQSTGRGLAGRYLGTQLVLVPFQLLTMGEIRGKYSDALVLGRSTGHFRDYTRNPYSGYEESDAFYFRPSAIDARYPPKTIMVAFQVNDKPVAAPWLSLNERTPYTKDIAGERVTLEKKEGELSITNEAGDSLPFYFEMWFSWAVQHDEEGIVFEIDEPK